MVRAEVVTEVQRSAFYYSGWFPQQTLRRWLKAMRLNEWGDDAPLQAIANVTRRPIVTWRLGLEQDPALCINRDFDETVSLNPV